MRIIGMILFIAFTCGLIGGIIAAFKFLGGLVGFGLVMLLVIIALGTAKYMEKTAIPDPDELNKNVEQDNRFK